MVESTCFQHTSSHPDKYNNSVDRIISKEEEREDPRRELQSIFEYSGVSTNNTRTTRFLRIQCILQELQCFHTQSSNSKFPQVNSMYRINSSTRNTTTKRLIPCHPLQIITRHLPATAPVHPSILSSSIHAAPYNSSQDNPKTTCPRTIQGYKSSPGHSPKTTRSRNTDRTVS